MKNFSLIFPAFGIDYLGNEDQILNNFSADISAYFKKAELFLETNLEDLKKSDSELFSQIDVYIYSCIISDILKKRELCPSYLAYYSMGIYSALYFSGSITFEYGLNLIKTVYDSCIDFLKEKNNKFTMALIIGLEYDDVYKLFEGSNLKIEIINQNNRYNIILSGMLEDINLIMEKAIDEGALKAKLIPTKIAFHSTIMNDASLQIKEKISIKDMKDSSVKLISAHNQRTYDKKSEIKEEIIKNISCNINWMKTFNKLLSLDNKIFIEAGPGESLAKIAKFIDGDFKIFTINKLASIIGDLHIT